MLFIDPHKQMVDLLQGLPGSLYRPGISVYINKRGDRGKPRKEMLTSGHI